MASKPAARMAWARSCATLARMSLHATRAPAAANPDATMPPMLRLVPVTKATLPARACWVGALVLTASAPRREDLVRVEAPGLHERAPRRAAEAQLASGPGQGEPVEDLLLAGVLDGGGGRGLPAGEVPGDEGVVEGAVRARVRGQSVRLVREEGVGPRRRRHERDPPRALGQVPRHRTADVHEAPRCRRRRIQFERLAVGAAEALRRHDAPAVAVDRHAHEGPREAG